MKEQPLFTITENIVRGVSRGKKLGFPTANLTYSKNIPLDFGVYIVSVKYSQKVYYGVANVGIPITFFGDFPRIDVHILDFEEDLYGKKITVYFWKKIREIKKFPNEQKLIWQIEKDIDTAKDFFQQHKL